MTFESFGLSRDPFASTAGEGRLFTAAAAERAQTALQQAISEAPRLLGQGGPRTRIALFIGAAGVGKTTLITTLRPRLEQAGWLVATWNAQNAEQQPFVSAVSLLETAFAATPVSVHLAAEHTAVAGVSVVQPHLAGLDRPTVLIVDDADALIEPTIEDLFQVKAERALKGERCFCVVLVGTPLLVERCRDLDAVTARAARGDEIRLVRLQGLSEEEIEPYLADRLAAAGGVAANVFTADAMARICAYSRGLPAVINRLGQAALALAEARGHRVVEAALLDEAALDCWLDEEKVAYSGIDDLSAEQRAGTAATTETLSSPPSTDSADALITRDAPVAACSDQDRAPVLRPDTAADAEAPAAAVSCAPEQPEAPLQPEAATSAAAATPVAQDPPKPEVAAAVASVVGFVRAQLGTGGKTIAAAAAVGALLVVGTAALLRQLALPSPPPQRTAEAVRPTAEGRDSRPPAFQPGAPERAALTRAAPATASTEAASAATGSVAAPVALSAQSLPPGTPQVAAAAEQAALSAQAPSRGVGVPVLRAAPEALSIVPLATGPIGDTDSLVERGTVLAGLGHIDGARRFFAAAASRGDGRAATLLARTYDPLFSPASAVSGTRPDPVQAGRWYAEAARLGDAGAAQRLRALKADPASQQRN